MVTPDARNHGDSPRSLDMTYSRMAEDVRELVRQVLGQEEEKLTFMGQY